MKPTFANRCGRQGHRGYALVMMMFFLALLVLSTAVVAPTVLSNIQREKEAEMVWRGKQYVRGVRLFYMKVHRFPTSLDELTKPTNGIRFMRQAYKDPMNTTDGSWRLIYVGPSGQLIGSVNQQAIGMFGTFGGVPSAAGLQQSAFGGAMAGSAGSLFGSAGLGATTGAAGAAGSTVTSTNPAAGQTAGSSMATDLNAQNPDASDDSSNPHPLATMDASNTIGGNIIGVGSKVNKKSFLWYQKAKNYRQFEFIWDPSKDMRIGAASQGIGTPVQNTGGTPGVPGTTNSPFSTGQSPQPSQGTNPSPNPNNLNPNPGLNPPLQAPPNL